MVPPPEGANVAGGNILSAGSEIPLGGLSGDFENQISGKADF